MMEGGRSFIKNNTTAELTQSWHIPRPTLARSSNSSHGSTSSSTNSTQSARSGSLLLSAANLAQIHAAPSSTPPTTTTPPDHETISQSPNTRDENLRYYLESNSNAHLAITMDDIKRKKQQDPDAVSIASSMHFTVVNVNSRPPAKPRGFCKKHRLSVLVVTMSAIFTVGIIAAIFLLEMRARRQMPH